MISTVLREQIAQIKLADRNQFKKTRNCISNRELWSSIYAAEEKASF